MNVRYLVLVFLTLLVLGCSKPLPSDKLQYAGNWQSPEMQLLILADGSVGYKRLKSGISSSIQGPLKQFVGDDFLVGIGPLTTTFVVSQPPTEVDGQWVMTVDGVQLTRR